MSDEDVRELLRLLQEYMEKVALEPGVEDSFEEVEKTLTIDLSYLKS